MDSIIPTKWVTIFPDNKPWVTKDLKEILNKKKRVFFTDSELEKRDVNRELKCTIKKCKTEIQK